MDGLVSKLFAWFFHPINDDSKPVEWLAGLVLVLILAYLWSTVIRMID